MKELRQLDFPLNSLHKHHLVFLPPMPNAALYMETDVSEMGYKQLSGQIDIDEKATLIRGLYLARATAMAVS